MKTIAVTTLNPNKLDCVSRTFENIYKCLPNVIGYNCESGVPDGQPYGIDGTYQGAQQRILNLKGELKFSETNNYDFIVSIENGISGLQNNDGTTYIDYPVVIVHDVKRSKDFVQIGGSRTIPVDEMRRQKHEGIDPKSRGDWVRNYYDNLNYSQTRETLIDGALIMCIETLLKETNK